MLYPCDPTQSFPHHVASRSLNGTCSTVCVVACVVLSHLRRVTRVVPQATLIHLSLFLFFTGLPILLFNFNRTVFNFVVTWLGICIAGYVCQCIALMLFPLYHSGLFFKHGSLYDYFPDQF
jgi:hypothetical protein